MHPFALSPDWFSFLRSDKEKKTENKKKYVWTLCCLFVDLRPFWSVCVCVLWYWYFDINKKKVNIYLLRVCVCAFCFHFSVRFENASFVLLFSFLIYSFVCFRFSSPPELFNSVSLAQSLYFSISRRVRVCLRSFRAHMIPVEYVSTTDHYLWTKCFI